MDTSDLHKAAQKNSGTPITDEEYRLALPAARRKLEYINARNGTRHGEPYLAILIAEAVEAQRLARYLDTVNALRKKERLSVPHIEPRIHINTGTSGGE